MQKAFLGTQAFDLEHGFTDTTMEIAQVKRAMIKAARRVILLTDSSKLGHSGFTLTVRSARLSAGAGFVVAFAGGIIAMPGLPKAPAALTIDVNEQGEILGLF